MKLLESYLQKIIMLLFMGLSLTMVSCDEDEEEEEAEATMTLYEIMEADSDLSTMKGYVDANATLLGYMQGSTDYTVFLPNNGAFIKLEEILGSSLDLVDPDIVNSVLAFHFSTTIVTEIEGDSILTLQTEYLEFNEDGTLKDGGSDVAVEVLSSTTATNGETYVVETILIPPTIFTSIGANVGRLSQPILLGASFTILADAIAKADATGATPSISSILASDKDITGIEYTVFAPSNATFETAGLTADSFDGATWYGLIMNHITDTRIGSSAITAPSTITTLAGGTLTILSTEAPIDEDNGILTGIVIDANGDTTPEAQVAVSDIVSNNGTLHVIAGILNPTPAATEQ